MAKNWYPKIWQAARKIPRGRVTTYGEVAKQVGLEDSRVVGWALHANRNPKIPCHRVVNRFGRLATGYSFGGWQKQKRKLLKEGIKFIDKKTVDFNRFGLIDRSIEPKRFF